MKYVFLVALVATSLSMNSQQCPHIHYDPETIEETMIQYYQHIDSLLHLETPLSRSRGNGDGLNVPLNFIFFYDLGERMVPEEDIKATVDQLNTIYDMNNINVHFYMGCVEHIFDEPEMVVWDNFQVGINALFGLWQINFGFNDEFIIQSLSDLFTDGINVFVPDEIDGVLGMAGLVGPARIIAIERDQVTRNQGSFTENGDGTFTNVNAATTFAHEMGHYCGLFHTDDPFWGSVLGIGANNTVNPLGWAFRKFRLEAVNRDRNYSFGESLLIGNRGRICRRTADGLCSTNADPGIANTFNLVDPTTGIFNCNIPVTNGNLAFQDPWDTPYLTPGEEPMLENIMTQRIQGCDWQFSLEQGQIITNFLTSRFGDNTANPDSYEPNNTNEPGSRTAIALNEVQLHTRHEFTCDGLLDPVDNLIYLHDVTNNNSTLATYDINISTVAGENNPVDDVLVFEAMLVNGNAQIVGPAITTRAINNGDITISIAAACNNHPAAYIIQVVFNDTGNLANDLGCYNIEVTDEPVITMTPLDTDILCANQNFQIVGAPTTATITWSPTSLTLTNTSGSITSIASYDPLATSYSVSAVITDGPCTKTIINNFEGISTMPVDYDLIELKETCWDALEPDGLHTYGNYQISPTPVGASIEWSVAGGEFLYGTNKGNTVRVRSDNPKDFTLSVKVVDECGLITNEWLIVKPLQCFMLCVGNGTSLTVEQCALNVDLDMQNITLDPFSYIITELENRRIMDTVEFM